MIQPSVYSFPQILAAALELVREKGWEGVSARAIAKKLGSSTMPIYSHVSSIEELEEELREKARSLMKEYQRRRYTEHPLLNLAFGYVTFARDEKNLFRFLYLEKPAEVKTEHLTGMKETFFADFGEDSPQGSALMKMQESGLEELIQHTWIFTHGLAMLVNSGSFGCNSNETILNFLMNAGEAFYLWGIGEGRDALQVEDLQEEPGGLI